MRAVLVCCLTTLITACGGFDGLTVCNGNARGVNVVVTDDEGTPLEGLSFRTVHLKTDTRIVPDSQQLAVMNWGHRGVYPVIHRSHRHLLSERGDALRFVASDEHWVATGDFVVADGGCDIIKRSGPDTIVAF